MLAWQCASDACRQSVSSQVFPMPHHWPVGGSVGEWPQQTTFSLLLHVDETSVEEGVQFLCMLRNTGTRTEPWLYYRCLLSSHRTPSAATPLHCCHCLVAVEVQPPGATGETIEAHLSCTVVGVLSASSPVVARRASTVPASVLSGGKHGTRPIIVGVPESPRCDGKWTPTWKTLLPWLTEKPACLPPPSLDAAPAATGKVAFRRPVFSRSSRPRHPGPAVAVRQPWLPQMCAGHASLPVPVGCGTSLEISQGWGSVLGQGPCVPTAQSDAWGRLGRSTALEACPRGGPQGRGPVPVLAEPLPTERLLPPLARCGGQGCVAPLSPRTLCVPSRPLLGWGREDGEGAFGARWSGAVRRSPAPRHTSSASTSPPSLAASLKAFVCKRPGLPSMRAMEARAFATGSVQTCPGLGAREAKRRLTKRRRPLKDNRRLY